MWEDERNILNYQTASARLNACLARTERTPMEFTLRPQNLILTGNPVPVKALCYVNDWYKGFTVLTWYKHGEYYPGREKELTEAGNSSLNGMIEKILSKYSQSKREIADQKTFADIFLEYYENKFGQPYNHPGKSALWNGAYVLLTKTAVFYIMSHFEILQLTRCSP